MTITTTPTQHAILCDPALATHDLYRAIHKAIRSELFNVIRAAGVTDPADRAAHAALAAHVESVGTLLVTHAEHEDTHIDPPLEAHLPDLSARIESDHVALDRRFASIVDLASTTVDAPSGDRARFGQWLHLELSTFTAAYLEHIDLEERVVMPALERAVGVERVMEIHGAILASIPPEEMARSLALMLPVLHIEEQVEMLTGIRMTAPAGAYAGVVSLARSVLWPDDFARLDQRLAGG